MSYYPVTPGILAGNVFKAIIILSSTNNLVVNKQYVQNNTLWNGTKKLQLTLNVPSNVTIGSTSNGTPAITFSGFDSLLHKITLVVNGNIFGAGGPGGTSTANSNGGNGQPGGTALKTLSKINIINNGIIGGGGGGNGGDGASQVFTGYTPNCTVYAAGGTCGRCRAITGYTPSCPSGGTIVSGGTCGRCRQQAGRNYIYYNATCTPNYGYYNAGCTANYNYPAGNAGANGVAGSGNNGVNGASPYYTGGAFGVAGYYYEGSNNITIITEGVVRGGVLS